jgi:hypothetical protein
MAFWTIIGTGLADVQGKSFGVTLDTDKKTWVASGPSVDLFFSSKTGTFKITGLPELGTQLITPAGKEAAFFHALDGSTPVGFKAQGRASGVTFDWKLDSK